MVLLSFQIVQLEDVKPAPALWHEDSGRKPWENGRYLVISYAFRTNKLLSFYFLVPFTLVAFFDRL